MLIDYKILVEKYGFAPKGVIHVGGHRGEEQVYYDALGVEITLWFEAIRESVIEMHEKFKDRNDILIMDRLISDKIETVEFNITNNLASSSMLDLGTHKSSHPKIHYTEKRKLKTDTLKHLLFSETLESFFNPNNYDTLNIDVQGAELKVLKGTGDILNDIKYIYTEVNTGEVYKGCALLPEIDEYLAGYGFERVETKMTPFDWGDAFYINQNFAQ